MMAADQIIIVDDERDIREAYAQTIELEGMQVTTLAQAGGVLDLISPDWPGVVVTDLLMPRMDGLELLQKIQQVDPDIPVIMVTAHGDISIAVKAMRNGAYDFLEKPPDPLHMLEIIRRGLRHRALILENRRLRSRLGDNQKPLDAIIGNAPCMDSLRQTISMLANADVDTLITGETGTGKEVVANALHRSGPRAKQKFVALNCAALPESLIESELFGHEKGAFTSADARRVGKIEYAHKGIVFLDEIESMPLAIQVKLLRVLQERSFERVGSNQTIKADITVIAAAKADLKKLSDEGKFRADLYYRLNVATIDLPLLSQRTEDIPLLFMAFVEQAASSRAVDPPSIPVELLTVLMQHNWPGNVRELKNTAEKYVLGLPLGLPLDLGENQNSARTPASLSEIIESVEKQAIAAALSNTNGQISETAKLLELPRKTLYLRMQKYHLNKEDFRRDGQVG